MAERTFVVYALSSSEDQSIIRYVGKAVDLASRVKGHKREAKSGKSTYKAAWIRKVIADGYRVEAIVLSIADTEREIFELERHHIARLRASGCHLTNLTDGGEGKSGLKCSEETRKRLSEANRGNKSGLGTVRSVEAKEKDRINATGRTHTAETRRKIGDIQRGKKHGPRSVETRAKISAAHTGRVITYEARAKMRLAKLGKKRGPMPAEQRQHIGDANRGKLISPDHRKRLSEYAKGRSVSPETREKIRSALRGRTRPVEVGQKIRDGWARRKREALEA
jgi:hypothetical protein